ncbi:MAG: protein-L-isoaspartate O-methyltransferase [Bacteroidetes bacterium GWF2_41_61]|jgi:protein-L-isoaspartate(D-aspartate) O-methyltransferase|nr:MAG: protein-L-isoaspartate O-methyltransferase [Bacteroidetes bacterium GWE2_40_15]OFY31766.1 MAG: protein-L-isoaspartate O-methyltransferase [Bacteroidetes bacterium GWF2_41_61]OFY91262.1 MAG: protein-L-isoaspartate O-methyltransferase [Bacteroidetes bacterium RIFOXYA12_FULL_40_10]PKP07537.1 MAG: protein-L-isoaspartate O-methyltransferase [Bacteroidetes bacterium HGW-Bacteroidetes-5]HBG23903.1 protein-L-isoaspartate O-methyltransferase [Rikenellaceae bacterium]
MLDTLQHKGRRKQLLAQLSAKFDFDPKVIDAMYKVPRHIFVEYGLDHLAYLDKPLPIGAKQTISQPYTVAMQTHLLNEKVSKFEKVLEIGTGCAYQTAVLAQMGMRVYSIERQRSLYMLGQKNLTRLEYHTPLLFFGDGFAGLPQFAPFKGILITCGAPEIPNELLRQLAIGGRMVIPIGTGTQRMVVIDRVSEKDFTRSEHGDYKFVPMLSGTED